MHAEPVDATVVPEEPGVAVAVVNPPAPTLFRTEDPVEIVEEATRVANALRSVLERQQLTTDVQGKPHVRVEGWTTLGAMVGVTAVCVATEQLEAGWKATVEARNRDGRVIGRADAVCTRAERRWKTADDYAILSMAQTRATSKAMRGPLGFVIALAGYESTPAEEIEQEAAQAAAPAERRTGLAPGANAAPGTTGAPGARPLTAAAKQKIVDAVEASPLELGVVLGAVGVSSPVELNEAHAREIRGLIDGAATAVAETEAEAQAAAAA